MSSVLPINTQRYQSGDYTLEITAHPSPLSQWSDRTVIRQLRFSLWIEQPERRRLAAGDQQQLMELSQRVEAYVQTHLTQQSWPANHRLTLLNQDLEVSTLQLFDLAEVLNAYGQNHITLPAAPKRRRSHWWTGSAAASLLIAVGVTTIYFQNRPASWNEAVTSQAPEVASDEAFEQDAAVAPEGAPAPETTQTADLPVADTPTTANKLENSSGNTGLRADQPSSSRVSEELPLESEEPLQDEPAAAPPRKPLAESATEQQAPEPAPEQRQAAAPPPAPAPTDDMDVTAAAPREELEAADTLEAEEGFSRVRPAEPEAATLRLPETDSDADEMLLAVIAAQLAPYQPPEAPYPLVYRLQIAADGAITTIEPIGDSAPEISVFDQITPAPGRALNVEVTFTGAERPLVQLLE